MAKKPLSDAENYILTYRRLRKAIGLLGAGLPFLLLLMTTLPITATDIQPSISHFYYTNLREIFTGILCATGLFLITYKGHNNPNFLKNDSALTNIAGFMAFGIAFVPTNPVEDMSKGLTLIPISAEWLGWLHFGFAGFFFLATAIISINVFTIGQKADPGVPKSTFNENNIYKVCGFLILLFIVLVPVLKFKYSTLILEALALLAFGTSWLIKGRILGDKGKVGEKLYRESNARSSPPVPVQ